MNEKKHTPGPWHVVDLGPGQGIWVAATEDGVGFRGDGSHYMSVCASAIGEANARLIAPAPELLAALADIALVAKNGTGHNLAPVVRLAQRIEAMALSAIAKAEGR